MDIKKVFVIGAGVMGTGITQVSATCGYDVYLYDINTEMCNKSVAKIEKQLNKSVEKGKMSADELKKAMDRISVHSDIKDVVDCQLVIEAASENLKIKQEIFKEVDMYCSEGTLLASNTSSCSITAIASALKNPENFAGLHFFNPVPMMKLVEMISGLATNKETRTMLKDFAISLKKTPVDVKDGPGFVANRIAVMAMNEAVEMLDQGYGGIEDIDLSMTLGYAFPMGMLELIDMIGIDVVISAMEGMYIDFADSKYRPALLLKKMARAGYLGQKTGKGFYIYSKESGKVPNKELEYSGKLM